MTSLPQPNGSHYETRSRKTAIGIVLATRGKLRWRDQMKWEYLAIEETLDPAKLGEFGQEGWELVAVVSPGHFVLHYFFKRMVAPAL